MLLSSLVRGGIKLSIGCFKSYILSSHFNQNALIDYATRYGNNSIFKRWGYLASVFLRNEKTLIERCHSMTSKGNAQLDPYYKGNKLITHWNLFIPTELNLEE